MSWQGRGYKLGTRVQHRNGYIVVKVEGEHGEGKMMAESRRIWELTHGELEAGDRVFHIDGDRTNNEPYNLAMVHFNQTKFTFLKTSRQLESWEQVWGKGIIRTINKKTGRVLVNS